MVVKKYLILFIALLLTSQVAFCADVSRLYRVKEVEPEQVEKVLTPFVQNNFKNVLKADNTYILENKDLGFYYVIILADKDEDCYFYYMSNNEDESLRKDLIKNLKNNDFKPKTVRDSSLKSFFYGEAYTALAHSGVNTYLRSTSTSKSASESNSKNAVDAKSIEYDFSDEAQAKFDGYEYSNPENFVKLQQTKEPSNEKYPQADYSEEYLADTPITLPPISAGGIRLPKIESSNSNGADSLYYPNYHNIKENNVYKPSPNALSGSVIYIDSGATFTAALLSDISSDSLVNNDNITAELDADWVYDGQLIAPEGSIITGRAVETSAASFAMKNGRIGLSFYEIMTPDGNVIPLKTNKVYIVGNSSRAMNVTKRVVGGAATGLLLSAVSIIMGVDPTRAIITGASLGAGAGAVSAISSKGEEIRVIEGSQLQIMLTEPLTVQLYM